MRQRVLADQEQALADAAHRRRPSSSRQSVARPSRSIVGQVRVVAP